MRDDKARALLMQRLQNDGELSTQSAVDMLNVSTATVRRIFTRLADENKVIRIYGGIRLPDPAQHYEYSQLEQRMLREKVAIGQYAAKMIEEDDFIFIDCGTTTVQLANALVKRITEKTLKNISVVTNSLMNLQQLAPVINVILTGG